MFRGFWNEFRKFLTKKFIPFNSIKIAGQFYVEQWRDGKLINKLPVCLNGVTNGGKDKALDILFYTATKISTWYCGLISSSGYSVLAAADTMSSHAGWSEFTGYSQSNRVTWTTGAPSSQVVTNSTVMAFSVNASGTVKGVFITSDNAKSGTTGTLWATALFAADLPVVNGDTLNLTYSVNAA